MINKLSIGNNVNGIYLLRSGKTMQSKKGDSYFVGTLADRSGGISCVYWNYTGSLDQELGAPILITGKVKEYQGKKQITIYSAQPAPEDAVILSEILPTATDDAGFLYLKTRMAIATIEDDDYRLICETIYDENKELLLTAPASVSSHHAYLGGYLTHIYAMVSGAIFLSVQYPAVNRSLLLTAVLLHDIGKLHSYKYSRYGYAYGYTDQGTLLGHASLGSSLVYDTAMQLAIAEDKVLPLQNIILHHHNIGDHTQLCCSEGKLLQTLDYVDCCAVTAKDRAA